MINFLTFGNKIYYNSLNRIKIEAESFNIFDKILIYNDKDLENFPEFWEKHSNFVLNNPRGYGYWIWKPYLTMKTLDMMQDNDILVYADAGCSLNIAGINRLYDYFQIVKDCEFGILSFSMPHNIEKHWTKMDLINYIDINNNIFLNEGQLHATVFIIRKCEHSSNLVKMWYDIASSNNYNLINDSPSIMPNDINFNEHRHDQSIFSLLRKKYGSHVLIDETYFETYRVNKNPILGKRLK